MAALDVLDLSGDAIAWIEEQVGMPFDQWGDAPKGRLFPLVLATFESKGNNKERDRLVLIYGMKPMSELVKLVVVDDPLDEPSANGSQSSPEPQAGP